VILGKGNKFSAKALANIDYQNINPLGWTGDAKTDDAINTLLHNYNIRYNDNWDDTSAKSSTSRLVMNCPLVY